jgi:hypothetical protein
MIAFMKNVSMMGGALIIIASSSAGTAAPRVAARKPHGA